MEKHMADTSTPKIDILDSTEKAGEQLVSVVKQTQSVALDVARAFAQALPPVPARTSEAVGVIALPDVEALAAYGFDLAGQLLAAQKDFAVSFAHTFAPAKSA
jgi:hypothetical protein